MSKMHQCPTCSAPVPAGSRFCQSCGAGISPKSAPVKKGAGSQWMLFVGGAMAIVLLVAGAMMAIGQSEPKAPPAVAADGTIVGAGPIPQWLATADPSIIADYAWAAEHYEELSVMPCYCGCNSVGHTSNAACYFKWDEKGRIEAYDAHALG